MFCRFGACFNISPWILLLLLLAASECFLFGFLLFLPVYQEVIQIFCILIFLMPLAAIFPPSNRKFKFINVSWIQGWYSGCHSLQIESFFPFENYFYQKFLVYPFCYYISCYRFFLQKHELRYIKVVSTTNNEYESS